jgi:hypothetical protein
MRKSSMAGLLVLGSLYPDRLNVKPAIYSCQALISPPTIEGEIELQGITYPLIMAYSLPYTYSKHLEAKSRIFGLDDVGNGESPHFTIMLVITGLTFNSTAIGAH